MFRYTDLHQVTPAQHPFVTSVLASPWQTQDHLSQDAAGRVLGLGRDRMTKLMAAGLLPTVAVAGHSARRIAASTVELLSECPQLVEGDLHALGDDALVIRVGGPQILPQPDGFDRLWFGWNATMPRSVSLSGTAASWVVHDWAGAPMRGQDGPLAPRTTNVKRLLIAVSGFVVDDVEVTSRILDAPDRTAFVVSDHNTRVESLVGSRLPDTGFSGPVLPASQWSERV